MKKDIWTEKKANEEERKKDLKNILDVNLLELILVKKILMCMLKLVKYTITLMNQLKSLK